ncbi:hypothetical protein [[Kitasatospora] papulosa]|uniref:hypothetical protein n=1 Tax=[Kitasatospora] papulosa TaxID=1464011 RepID=UPI0038573DC7
MGVPDDIRTLAATLLLLSDSGTVWRGETGVRINISPLEGTTDKPWEHTYSVDLSAAAMAKVIARLHGGPLDLGRTPVPPDLAAAVDDALAGLDGPEPGPTP